MATDVLIYRPTYAALFPLIVCILLYGEKVKDGRWAYTEIPIVRDDIEADVYGKLRAPWSTSDKPWGSVLYFHERCLLFFQSCDYLEYTRSDVRV